MALIINTLFSTIFGRRLGTTTDGTSLRGSPQAGVDPDFNDSTTEHFTTNTRDVTLNQAITLKFQSTPHSRLEKTRLDLVSPVLVLV